MPTTKDFTLWDKYLGFRAEVENLEIKKRWLKKVDFLKSLLSTNIPEKWLRKMPFHPVKSTAHACTLRTL